MTSEAHRADGAGSLDPRNNTKRLTGVSSHIMQAAALKEVQPSCVSLELDKLYVGLQRVTSLAGIKSSLLT